MKLRRGVGRCPTDAVLHQRLKSGIGPSALVMSPRRVKHTTFAVLAHPRPWLGSIFGAAFCQHDAVGVVFSVHVSLVPTLDRRDSLHHGMIRLDDALFENA